MPIVLRERDGHSDYCALVNSKNSYGGYTGFAKVYFWLRKDNKGEFTTGEVRLIGEVGDGVPAMALNDLCKGYGYTDFSQASAQGSRIHLVSLTGA